MKKNYLSLLIIVLALTACAKRFEVDMAVPALVSTELRIVSEDQTGFYAINENTIGDVNLFLYGDFNYHFYFALSTPVISFEVLPGSYKMYLITNAHRDIGMLAKKELLAYDIASESMFDNEDIPMTAEVLLTVGNSGIPSPAEILVKRCAAKIIYSIEVATEVASSIKLSSLQFCNLPRKIRPFGNGSISSTIPDDYYDSEIISLGGHTVGAGIQYLFENCQGTVASITDQKDKSPVNAPACAAYIRILAQGSNEVIEYIVFLGENNTSDFNMRRNTKHEMNLVIQGKNEIDFRVKVFEGLYYGTANSIICNGYQVSFDVTPYRTSRALYYKYTNVYAGKEYEPVSAKVVWQGAANLISSLSLKNNLLTVNTNGRKGNAVLAVCDKTGAVLWSFHSW